MTSASNLSSKMYNRLQANKLQALDSKVSDYGIDNPSYLYSLLLSNATLDKTTHGGFLTFTGDDAVSIIQFTDRPLRQTNDNYSLDNFVALFDVNNDEFNAFSEDPPNGVWVNEEEQKTYELVSLKYDDTNKNYVVKLKLIEGEIHTSLEPVTGATSFFVDNSGHRHHHCVKAKPPFGPWNPPGCKYAHARTATIYPSAGSRGHRHF